MKILVCISGNLRTYKNCYRSLFSFLDGVDYDIMLYVKEDEYLREKDTLQKIYNPLSIATSQRKVDFDSEMKDIFKEFDGYPNVNILQISYDLLPFYFQLTNNENCEYDYIIRCRFDSIFGGKLKSIIENLSKNILYLPEIGNHHGGYNDTFALGSKKIMMEYFDFNTWLMNSYKNFFNDKSEIGNFYPELILKKYISEKNINVKFSNELNCKILREEYIDFDYNNVPITSIEATANRNKVIYDLRFKLTKNKYFNKPLKIHTFATIGDSNQKNFLKTSMCQGIMSNGEKDVHIISDYDVEVAPQHILVTFGISTYSPELNRKMQKKISDHKLHSNPLLVMETAVIGRTHSIYSNGYFRVAWNGFMNDDAVFTDIKTEYPEDRWLQMKKHLNVELNPWSKNGKYILLIHQVNTDASIRGNDFSFWLNNTINEIKRYTDRSIKLRLHPHPVFEPVYPKRNDIEISTGTLQQDLDSAWATVSFTSGASIDSILAGVPVFAMHPGNMAFPVSNYDLKNLDSPIYPDREKWVHRLSYSQWNLDEIKSGKCWEHMKSFMPKINRFAYEYLD